MMRREPAVDRGWAWVVLAGVHVNNLLTNGYICALGVLYIEWKEYFQSDAATSSWLVSLTQLAGSPTSLLVGILTARFGARWVAMTGAAICGIATVLGSFCTDIKYLYICNAMVGVGVVTAASPGSIILPQYFKKRYALASGIFMLGASFGQMLFPLLFRVLIKTYGWRGTMFIIGAVQMNAVAAAALCRPFRSKTVEIATDRVEMSDGFESGGGNGLDGNGDSLNSPPEDSRSETSPGVNGGLVAVLTNTSAMLNVLAAGFYATASFVNFTHLPARCKEAGWSDDQSAVLVLVLAIGSLITRTTHGWLVDRGYVTPLNLQLLMLFVASVTACLNPVSDSYAFLVVYAAVLGGCVGISTPMIMVLMKTLVSPSEISSAFSLIWATLHLCNGTGTILAGVIFDVTGSYTATFLFSGSLFLAGAIMLGLIKLRVRQQEKLKRCPDGIYHRTSPDEVL